MGRFVKAVAVVAVLAVGSLGGADAQRNNPKFDKDSFKANQPGLIAGGGNAGEGSQCRAGPWRYKQKLGESEDDLLRDFAGCAPFEDDSEPRFTGPLVTSETVPPPVGFSGDEWCFTGQETGDQADDQYNPDNTGKQDQWAYCKAGVRFTTTGGYATEGTPCTNQWNFNNNTGTNGEGGEDFGVVNICLSFAEYKPFMDENADLPADYQSRSWCYTGGPSGEGVGYNPNKVNDDGTPHAKAFLWGFCDDALALTDSTEELNTTAPSVSPTAAPSAAPTVVNATEAPTFVNATEAPTFVNATEAPTFVNATEAPTFVNATEAPTFVNATEAPTTVNTTEAPSTVAPTVAPTLPPTGNSTSAPTDAPSTTPTRSPSSAPTTAQPTQSPTFSGAASSAASLTLALATAAAATLL